MPAKKKVVIEGNRDGQRVSSRLLEEAVQQAVREGGRNILVRADGQHGIGGRIWPRGEKVKITVEGPVGQRLGSMGMFGTEIVVKGGASDDVGWINCGARITVLGDVTNGAHNAAAQGVLYVQGGGGARCDTMTKHNPRFDPPESWYFRDVGDSFAEFKAGGIAVVCGVEPRNPESVLGYRPCVGMVGGTIYFRGPIQGYSDWDVKLLDLTDEDWQWLAKGMKAFLKAVDREPYYEELTRDRGQWRKLMAYTPAERRARQRFPMGASEFRRAVWDKEVGEGGIFAEYITHDRTLLPYITTGEDRRNRPVWANEKYAPPCQYACPSSIPSHRRAALIRQGKMKEALELVLQYSPLPATVCGQICPNLCMQSCTRASYDRPLNIKEYGRLAMELPAPKRARATGYKIGVIGGGPAGLSAAWQLALKGHDVDLYEAEDKLGGKIELCIPRERLPHEVLLKEISRFKEVGVSVHLGKRIDRKEFDKIYKAHDAVVVACGAHMPRQVKFPGSERAVSAIEFLKGINFGDLPSLKGKDVVVIGAGNVGMDVATQAWRCGARKVTAVDIQKPAAFGKELEMAERLGTEIVWPRFTEKYDHKARKLVFKDGSSLDADLVVVSVGEVPVTDFLPPSVHTERGWIEVNDLSQTSDVKVYAIGDATRPGLVTHAIGQGRTAADKIHAELMRFDWMPEKKQVVPRERIKTEYYDICRSEVFSAEAEANVCMSCATCRDCHMCEQTCYWGAISRKDKGGGAYEYVVDDDKCIGCGFCAGICPCGVWEMVENI
ncbi:MAG: FAD-dependent oxidoreductase [Thermodesulfovibrionales bacterium]